MAKKKSDSTKEPPEQSELERKVDAMMSVEPLSSTTEVPSQTTKSAEKTKPEPAKDKSTKSSATEQPTAPQLPPKLLKTLSDKYGDDAQEPDKPADPTPVSEEPDTQGPQPGQTIEPEESAESAESGTDNAQLPDTLEDNETDKAVDDIVATEANTQLAVDDARARRRTAEAEAKNQRGLLSTIFRSIWTWLIIIGVAWVAYAWYH